jgi:hypothetical protein
MQRNAHLRSQSFRPARGFEFIFRNPNSILALPIMLAATVVLLRYAPSKPVYTSNADVHPARVAELASMSRARLATTEVALLNLLCAQALPQAEHLDIARCLHTLDQWATHVKEETDRHLYRFRANPAEYDSSEGYFRMLLMSAVVYEDFHVRYNPDKIAGSASLQDPQVGFFADSRDVFLHGILGPRHLGSRAFPSTP